MKKENVIEFFTRMKAQNPEPKGELNYVNPFTLLVAVVLSAQATDVGVNKVFPALFAVADTPEKMVALGEDKIRDYIKTIGLFNAKAKNVYKLSQILIDKYGGTVPEDRDEFIKRIMGGPGEESKMDNGEVFINSKKLVEPYIPDSFDTTGNRSIELP